MTFTFLPIWPVFIFFFLRKNKKNLKDKSFKLKFNTMYHAQNIKNPFSTYVTPLFLARRFLFAFTMIFLADYCVF